MKPCPFKTDLRDSLQKNGVGIAPTPLAFKHYGLEEELRRELDLALVAQTRALQLAEIAIGEVEVRD